MPFTPAHPAIILPFLNRKFFSATGLIVGSVSPDFEYFFKARVHGVHGHTFPGIFYFDLPVCLLIAFVFHLLIKESFISNLPGFLQRRFQETRIFNFRKYFKLNYHLFILSSLLGISSHILWDSFTHHNSYFVQHLSFYQGSYIPFHGVKYPLWYALQHISTFTGLTIMFMYVTFLPPDNTITIRNPQPGYWLALILLGGLFFILRFTLLSAPYSLGNAVVTSISSVLLSICIVSCLALLKSAIR